jgi:hypothetical protein
MQRLEIPPGTYYGDLTVVREMDSTGKRRFCCKCDCGHSVLVRLDHLRSGHTSSCGRCGIEHKGKRRTIRAWAAKHNIKESTLRARLKVMGIGEALERK